MSIKLYNTLAHREEELNLSPDKEVNFYTCGPTVYDKAHIGNLRSYIFADILRRTLELNGYKVKWVMNITDVDDKTIKRTTDEFGKEATPAELQKFTAQYFEDFKKDLEAVNIPAEKITFIKVSDRITEIKIFIKNLLEKGHAYKTDDGVYFNIQKYQKDFHDYGELVGKDFLEGKKTGARVKVDEYDKENLSDFALWKGRDESDGDIFWSDPELGDGRPGWHIECSVINNYAFHDNPTDIHTGGVDLIFPHHTNEIAQSQPFYKPFARYWVHCEHLLVDNKKMAKSAGNFYTLEDLKSEKIPNPGLAFRYLTLQTNYKIQMNFTKDSLSGSLSALMRIAENHLEHLTKLKSETKNYTLHSSIWETFLNDLNDNLNTAEALGVIWQAINSKDIKSVDTMLEALGIPISKLPEISKPLDAFEIPQEIKDLMNEREEARRNKQFIKADLLRKKIEELGYTIEDTPFGHSIRRRQ